MPKTTKETTLNMQKWQSIQPAFLQPGDVIPAPKPAGGWAYDTAVKVVGTVRRSALHGMMEIHLATGQVVRAMPLQRIPFRPVQGQ